MSRSIFTEGVDALGTPGFHDLRLFPVESQRKTMFLLFFHEALQMETFLMHLIRLKACLEAAREELLKRDESFSL